MTENGKIFLVKNTILNTLAEQDFSIGLSLYLIQDIQQELRRMYNDIVSQELKEKEEEAVQQTIAQKQEPIYPISWEEEKEENNQDQAD